MELQAEARVRTIGAEAGDRLRKADPRPGRRRDRELADGEDRAHHLLGEVQDVVLDDERQLDVELRELGLAIRPLILVAEAACDLEVALETADHQQLLEDLRRLRQRVERAALQP